MDAARIWLSANGFTNVRDVHATQSCDFVADRDGIDHYIEVKGTTSVLGKIILTANEVALHKNSYPANVLIVVHGIDLDNTKISANGGKVKAFYPWQVADHVLSPLSYTCELKV